MHWYIDVLKKYAVFEGRARRKEYWLFFLFSVVIVTILTVIDEFMGLKFELGGENLGFLSTLYYLGIAIPYLAVIVRRLHDTDRSGWWILISLIPLIGGIILLVFTIIEGTKGENRFGPDPKAETARW
ncbi:MAG: DUF805 domain-containing protein [Gemmatimonadetes bacterium]|nr:DUF805 domain-containing protein [Gemmatimonadota bacterium]MYB60815.1 DUF805 domain-containing protein [Gemmatimonadota bacterium]